MEKLVVTRHKALYDWLMQNGFIDEDTPQLAKATIQDVKGKHVFGILPNWLACKTAKFTEVQLRLPAEMRGKELTIEDVEFYKVRPRTYEIREVYK